LDDERDEIQNEEIQYFTEEVKLSFDNLKQLTTLNAGSIVLIGTFLNDIFPSTKGTLDVSPIIKLLITASFICFGLSLVLSAYLMEYSARSLHYSAGFLSWRRSEPEGKQAQNFERRLRRLRGAIYKFRSWPLTVFGAGLFCFCLAVVLNLYR
jgi:hypothetical protein